MNRALYLIGSIIISAVIIVTHVPFTAVPPTHTVTFAVDTHIRHGLSLFRQDSLDQAAHALRQALAYYPQFSLLHYYLAEVKYQQGDLETAQRAYMQSIELDREFYPAYYKRALVLRDEGEYTTAIQLLETVIFLNPYYRAAYQSLAELYIETGNYTAAEQVYEQLRTVEARIGE